MKRPIYTEFNLDAKVGISQMIAITHTDDRNADVLEVNVRQNGAHIDLTGATVFARMVLHKDRDYLLSDSVPCTVSDSGNVLIPFDNAVVPVQKGNIKIEVNLTQADSVLTLQFPLWVSVNGSILDNAEVTPESKGTVPDLLREAAAQLSRVKDFATEDFVFENLDAALQGNPHTAPSLFVMQDAETNNYKLVYMDSADDLHVLFDFGLLPAAKGEKGEKGDAGRGVTSFTLNNGVLTANFDDRTSQTIGNVKGADGADGQDGANGQDGADWIPTAAEKSAIAAEAAGLIDISGKADKSAVESRLPVAITPHVGLVDSRNLSLYGTASLGNYHTSVPVEEGERYIISCRSSNNVYPGAFYTLNGAKVSSIFEDSATHLNVTITVPSGVDTLWINSKSSIIPLDEWKLYRIASAAEYTEHNNGCIVTLQNEREDEAVESLRRLKNLETLFDFRWKPFDKAYYCFVNDGSKSWMHVIYDVFHAHGVPLTAAVVGENIELANDADTTPGGRTVKQTLDAIVADGGEVMTYLNAQQLKSTDPFELWYDYAVKNGKHKIEAYGYRVRGLILSSQSARNSAVGQEICERFFDYSDRIGIKPQFNINRKQFADTATVADVKAYIDSTVGTPGFYPILFHRPSQDPWSTAAGMDEVLTYIEGKGSLAAISTYSAVFDEFGTNGFLTLGDLPVYNGGVV